MNESVKNNGDVFISLDIFEEDLYINGVYLTKKYNLYRINSFKYLKVGLVNTKEQKIKRNWL